jgi:hypothetical protein
MVNYKDPATIAHDSGAYAFPPGIRDWQPNLLVDLFDSGLRKALACHVWYICVSPSPHTLFVLASRLYSTVTPPLPDGNSSLPLTLSGMSSEVVAPTAGLYGFVAFFLGFVTAHPQPRICYRFTPLRA